jgi:alpha-L-arabinofuranosidase
MLSIQADQPGVQISSNLFGIFFEEINSAGDGGIYAEMVRNRNFEEPGNTSYWQLVTTGTATGTMNADSSLPLSSSNLNSLQLTFASGAGTVGAANNGWWGINFQAGQTYDLTLYARCSAGFNGSLIASMQRTNPTVVYAQGTITGLTTNWQSFSLSLAPIGSSTSGTLVLAISQPGTVWLDVVSLFPHQTFHNRTNGLRPDLAGVLVGLQPSFMRFPGGSWVDGDSLTNAYRWKQTIGPLGDRKVQHNLWGYYVNNGLGFHEYLEMCEDLHTEPLFVMNCGMDVNADAVPLAQMDPWVQDALDAIDYANGPSTSTWGSVRAAAGHPAPFNLKYIEIGNENGGSSYNDRYALFYDAIKGSYPQIHIIANNWGGLPSSRPVEISDEHYYSDPGFFINNATKYDSYSRTGPKVYVGEYAVTSGSGNGNLAGALGEAAFMTGLERNADIVAMASYAPLFANLNNKDWNPDLIYFDNYRVTGTPSYYVQQMFSKNRGDVVLPSTVTITSLATNPPPHGAIGLGCWNTQAEFTNVVVTKNSSTLYQSDFSSGAPGWVVYNGTWSTSGGLYLQTANTTDCRSNTGDTNWSDYTITLRARKISGSEGFLIMFNWLDNNDWTWWNIGGWNNTMHGIEHMVNGVKTLVGSQVAGSVVSNQWYDIRIVLSGQHIQCYLNNGLIHDVYYTNNIPHGAIGLGTWNTQSSFTNVVVTNSSQALFQSDFSSGAAGWQVFNGTWTTSGGVYQQTANITDCRSTTGDTNWSNYTLTLRARKDSGSEGFLILFNWQDNNNWTWWNIGGWGNTMHGIEQMVNGTKSLVGSQVQGSVQTGQWYDIRIVLSGQRIQCYLNGQLIHDVAYNSSVALVASASYSAASGQVIVKAVNVTAGPIDTFFSVNGLNTIAPSANLIQLTSPSALNENSLANPTNVFPVTTVLTNAATNFLYTLPANSLSILRLQTPPILPIKVGLAVSTNLNDVALLSNGIPVALSSFITNAVSVHFSIQASDGSTITNGTLQFLPGSLSAYIPFPAGALQPSAFCRVTLSDPSNYQLDAVSRGYFAQSSLSGDPLRLGLATYTDETLVYWTTPSVSLLTAGSLAGPWTTNNSPVAPIRIPESKASEFFRLQQ